MAYNGLLELELGALVLITLALTHVTIISVTLYLHRFSAHKAVDLHPILQHFFRFWLWLTTATNTREWTAVHRKHHAEVETDADPHSPQVQGLAKVLLLGAGLYRREAANAETLARYGQGTPDDWLERKVYNRYRNTGILLMALIDLALFGLAGAAVWAVQMLWIPFWAAGVINGVAHHSGYRNFDTPDASRNLLPWGLLIGGEELHNNHHAYPRSAKLALKRWELDIGWGYLKLFQALGLARIKQLAPTPERRPGKAEADAETLRALLAARMHIMAHYRRRVIAPAIKEAKAAAAPDHKPLLSRAKRLLSSQQPMLDAEGQQRLDTLFAQHPSLEIIYHYRLKLQRLGQRSSASKQELVTTLKQWCEDAETSGVRVLEDFALTLKSYGWRQAGTP